ncbi:MAG: UTP--glucose-1-phosphate uridylyltransferase GalU [Gammaproteobacteria bacterium]|nr:UTP--glucose-1-phosphate uridylyltransferase GalU [Gammaproteobacteria bacterium]
MIKKITKAVFPVAGMGTRFLPATKSNPKEMLPIVDKPLIQYAAEEAVAAGCTELIFVIGRNKRAIPDHFDKAYELEVELQQRGKTKLLEQVQNILPANVTCVYLRQAEALGLGHAVWCTKPLIGDEPFIVILADDLIDAEPKNCLQQMVELYNKHACSVLGVEEIPHEDTDKYGIVSVKDVQGRQAKIETIVEKPHPSKAPSNLAVVGRYILTPRIFELIETNTRGAGGEIQLTDAIEKLLAHETVLTHRFAGKRYDCGSKLGYLQATVEYALKHPELKEPFQHYLQAYCLPPLPQTKSGK